MYQHNFEIYLSIQGRSEPESDAPISDVGEQDDEEQSDGEQDEPLGAVAKYKIKKAKTPQEIVVIMQEERAKNKKGQISAAKKRAQNKAAAAKKKVQVRKNETVCMPHSFHNNPLMIFFTET